MILVILDRIFLNTSSGESTEIGLEQSDCLVRTETERSSKVLGFSLVTGSKPRQKTSQLARDNCIPTIFLWSREVPSEWRVQLGELKTASAVCI